jgi:hypothetical protein
MQAGMESCVAKSVLAGGAGFVLGGAFGLFMSSVSSALPFPLPTHLSQSKLAHFSCQLPLFQDFVDTRTEVITLDMSMLLRPVLVERLAFLFTTARAPPKTFDSVSKVTIG